MARCFFTVAPNILQGLTPLDIARQCNNTQVLHILSNVDIERQDDFEDDDDDVDSKVKQMYVYFVLTKRLCCCLIVCERSPYR